MFFCSNRVNKKEIVKSSPEVAVLRREVAVLRSNQEVNTPMLGFDVQQLIFPTGDMYKCTTS
jgi:hypothetical protein